MVLVAESGRLAAAKYVLEVHLGSMEESCRHLEDEECPWLDMRAAFSDWSTLSCASSSGLTAPTLRFLAEESHSWNN